MAAQWHDLLNVLFPEAEKYRIYPPSKEMVATPFTNSFQSLNDN